MPNPSKMPETIAEGLDEDSQSDDEDEGVRGSYNRNESGGVDVKNKKKRNGSARKKSTIKKPSSVTANVSLKEPTHAENESKEGQEACNLSPSEGEYQSEADRVSPTSMTKRSSISRKGSRLRKFSSSAKSHSGDEEESISREVLLDRANEVERKLKKLNKKHTTFINNETQTDDVIFGNEASRIKHFLIERMATTEVEIDEVRNESKRKDGEIQDLTMEVCI